MESSSNLSPQINQALCHFNCKLLNYYGVTVIPLYFKCTALGITLPKLNQRCYHSSTTKYHLKSYLLDTFPFRRCCTLMGSSTNQTGCILPVLKMKNTHTHILNIIVCSSCIPNIIKTNSSNNDERLLFMLLTSEIILNGLWSIKFTELLNLVSMSNGLTMRHLFSFNIFRIT